LFGLLAIKQYQFYYKRKLEVFLLKASEIIRTNIPLPPPSPKALNSEGYRVAKNGQNHFFSRN
jgi:hypothetical protein